MSFLSKATIKQQFLNLTSFYILNFVNKSGLPAKTNLKKSAESIYLQQKKIFILKLISKLSIGK